MLSARRQLIYWLIAVSSAAAHFVLMQRPWTLHVHTHIETIAAISFCTLIHRICRPGPSRRWPSSYCSYQLGIATGAVGTCGRIAEWLYRNYAVDAAEEGSRERAWEIGITQALLAFSLVYYFEFFRKPKLSDFLLMPSATRFERRAPVLQSLRIVALHAAAMACWLGLRYLMSLLLHLDSKEFADARILFRVDKDKHPWVPGAMMLLVEWPVRLAAGGITQAMDKATFELGDYDDNGDNNNTEEEEELDETVYSN